MVLGIENILYGGSVKTRDWVTGPGSFGGLGIPFPARRGSGPTRPVSSVIHSDRTVQDPTHLPLPKGKEGEVRYSSILRGRGNGVVRLVD